MSSAVPVLDRLSTGGSFYFFVCRCRRQQGKAGEEGQWGTSGAGEARFSDMLVAASAMHDGTTVIDGLSARTRSVQRARKKTVALVYARLSFAHETFLGNVLQRVMEANVTPSLQS